ncbi:hypothetical protein ACROYT_G043306 [Oculina patagonica]
MSPKSSAVAVVYSDASDTGFGVYFVQCGQDLVSDVFHSEMWREGCSPIPDHLQPLASHVQVTVLAFKADCSIRSYLAGFKRWKHWASSNCFIHMPANSFHVAVNLQCLILDANSPSPVLNAVDSIDWAQQLAGLPKVSVHPMVASLVSASQRILGKPKSKKEPITPEMLKTLVNSKISDASFFVGSENKSSKTDQSRDGAWIAIARSDRETCPVKALEQYIAAAKIDLCEDLPLFRALSSPRSTSTVRCQGLSYTSAREIVKDAFKDITDVSRIRLHSLRAGGATAAADAGIVDEFFKRHGHCTHSEVMITAIGKAVEYKQECRKYVKSVQKGEEADSICTWRSKKETTIRIQFELIKEDGGPIGLIENPSVLLKWMVSGPKLARLVLRQFEPNDEDKHPHAAPSRVLLACVTDKSKPRYTIQNRGGSLDNQYLYLIEEPRYRTQKNGTGRSARKHGDGYSAHCLVLQCSVKSSS